MLLNSYQNQAKLNILLRLFVSEFFIVGYITFPRDTHLMLRNISEQIHF